MADVTIKQLAATLAIPSDVLLVQLREAAMSFDTEDQVISSKQKLVLLKYLRSVSRDTLAGPSKARSIALIFKSVELVGVKAFGEPFRAEFSPDGRLYTISGANGSGKSTVMRALILVQKAFFANQMVEGTEVAKLYGSQVDEEVVRYMKTNDARISVVVMLDERERTIVLRRSANTRGWHIECEAMALVQSVWNIDRPSSIILYLDAGKSVLESEVRYTNLTIADASRSDLAIRCVFHPQHAFAEMYRQIIQDYILERLVPSSPPRTLYQRVTNGAFESLIGNISIANFSPRLDQQVALLARPKGMSRANAYDIRELSSGEKTLYFTLAYLFLADTVGTLIIDEPENHFHEHLLLRFAAFLGDLLDSENLSLFLNQHYDRPTYKKGSDAARKEESLKKLEKIYAQHKISQVFLLTHSKTLIYHAFSMGINYAITRQGHAATWSLLAPTSAEAELRRMGLTTTTSRILFVEGKGDSELLSRVMAEDNVRVHPLNGSRAVRETFLRISAIRNEIKGITFAFLVDRDGKPDGYFDRLKKEDIDFFEASFIALDRHEIENYLLDENIILNVIERERLASPKIPALPHTKISEIIADAARNSSIVAKKKTINARLEHTITDVFSKMLWGNKKLNFEDRGEVETMLASSLDGKFASDVARLVLNDVDDVMAKFSGGTADEWISRCDGKIALAAIVEKLAAHCGVTINRFKSSLIDEALGAEATELSKVIINIRSRFSGS